METADDKIFENQPEFLTVEEAAVILRTTAKTIYDWRYRPRKYGISDPEKLFKKFGQRVYLRTVVLKKWFISRESA